MKRSFGEESRKAGKLASFRAIRSDMGAKCFEKRLGMVTDELWNGLFGWFESLSLLVRPHS